MLTHSFLRVSCAAHKYYLLAQATADDKWSSSTASASVAARPPPPSLLSVCTCSSSCSGSQSVCTLKHILHRFISLIARHHHWRVRVNDTSGYDDENDDDDDCDGNAVPPYLTFAICKCQYVSLFLFLYDYFHLSRKQSKHLVDKVAANRFAACSFLQSFFRHCWTNFDCLTF